MLCKAVDSKKKNGKKSTVWHTYICGCPEN